MRKGRCSNDAEKCSLAASRAELAYAGIDSVCPECGSLLAAIARPVAEPAPEATVSSATATVARSPTPNESQQTFTRVHTYEPEMPAQRAGSAVMQFTQIIAVGAIIALIAFFAFRFVKPNMETEEAVTPIGDFAAINGVVPINPAQVRRVAIATEVRATPDAGGQIVAQLSPGTILDVSGSFDAAGTQWLRVTLPNDPSKSGFIRSEMLAALGDGDLPVTDPLQTTNAVAMTGTAQLPLLTASPTAPVTFYVASQSANVRLMPDGSSTKIGTVSFSTPVSVVGQRLVGARTWYQVQMSDSSGGWILGNLLSQTPPSMPLDAAANSMTAASVPVAPGAAMPQTVTSPTPPAAETPLMALNIGVTVRVNSAIANLRSKPNSSVDNIVEVLPRDSLMSIDDVILVNGVPWYQVVSPKGTSGWVSGKTVVENR